MIVGYVSTHLLRISLSTLHRFPVHCAVMGGSLNLVRWLVDTHLCPISVLRNAKGQLLSVQTSACRTLLDLAMSGKKPKTDILFYLVSKGLSIHDVKDTTLAPKTLEAMLKAGLDRPPSPVAAIIENDQAMELDESVMTATLDDQCALCCERDMDCVLIPCGHQICCIECGHQIQNCPVCKVNCSVLRIFRQ